MRRWRKRILLALAILALLLAAGTSFLLFTQPGARFLGKVVVPRIPGSLQYIALAGRIMSHMTLDDIRFENDLVRVSIDHLDLNWKPSALVHRTAHIENFEIRGLHVEVLPAALAPKEAPPEEEKPQSTTPPQVPIGLRIDRGRVEGISVEIPDQLTLEATHLEFGGNLDSLAVNARARVAGPQLPTILVPELRATASLTQVDLQRLVLQLLDGQVLVQARASWVSAVQWEAEVAVEDLHPGALTPAPDEWPGSVSLALSTHGVLTAEGQPRGELRLQSLHGSLRDLPLNGEATLGFDGLENAEIAANLTWGPLSLQTTGRVAAEADLDLRLAVESLAPFVPDVEGAVQLEGRVTGARTRPHVEADLRAMGIAAPQASVDSVTGHISLGTGPADESQVDLRLQGIDAAGRAFSLVGLQGSGNLAEHGLTLQVDGDSLDVSLALHGSYADSTWSGTLEHLDVTEARFGSWNLPSPASVSLAKTAASLDSLRLESLPTSLTVGGGWSKDTGWQARLRLADVDERFWQSQMPQNVEFAGRVFLQADVSGQPDGRVLGEVGAEVRDGRLQLHLENGEEHFDLRQASLRLLAGEENAELRLQLGLHRSTGSELVGLDGTFEISQGIVADSTFLEHPLRGSLQGEVVDLYFLDALTPQVKRSSGRIELAFDAAGTVKEPDLSGEARLTDVQIGIPVLGLELRDLQLVASGDPREGFQLVGSVLSGEGNLQIDGKTPPLPTEENPATLRIRGERFKVMDTPEIDAEISTDLAITVGDKRARVDGKVSLPLAKVELIETPPSAVAPSSDVVFVETEEESKPPLEPHVDVTLSLGEDVTFRGFGTYAKLEGQLRVQQEGVKFPTGSGEIRVTEGYYRAYGQNLEVEKGRIMFAGPVNNPGLDIRVSREAADGTVAGIHIGGTAEEPTLRLFSDPSMRDSDVLSYIITGRPISEGSGEDQAKVNSAAAMMGGNIMTTYLGSKVGLDEARIESGTGTNDASLVTGKYLTPKIYMSYAIGLFDQGNLMRLRYIFSPRWSVQTETGRAMGADLFYNIERGGSGTKAEPGNEPGSGPDAGTGPEHP